nr:hypothetical protein Iba_chr06cCG8670 [Ipomoea batatas]
MLKQLRFARKMDFPECVVGGEIAPDTAPTHSLHILGAPVAGSGMIHFLSITSAMQTLGVIAGSTVKPICLHHDWPKEIASQIHSSYNCQLACPNPLLKGCVGIQSPDPQPSVTIVQMTCNTNAITVYSEIMSKHEDPTCYMFIITCPTDILNQVQLFLQLLLDNANCLCETLQLLSIIEPTALNSCPSLLTALQMTAISNPKKGLILLEPRHLSASAAKQISLTYRNPRVLPFNTRTMHSLSARTEPSTTSKDFLQNCTSHTLDQPFNMPLSFPTCLEVRDHLTCNTVYILGTIKYLAINFPFSECWFTPHHLPLSPVDCNHSQRPESLLHDPLSSYRCSTSTNPITVADL